MLVSDRAKGLVKLGKPEYFDVCSMPDLFHFNQELGHAIGAPIGKAWKKAKIAYETSEGLHFERKPFEDAYLLLDVCRRHYQNGIHGIHKVVQPYNSDGSFSLIDPIRKSLIANLSLIEKQGLKIGKEVKIKTIQKVIDQVPDILSGITTWQQWTVKRTKIFTEQSAIEIRKEELEKWLLHYLLPVFIWELALRRVPSRKKNKRLIKYYKEVLEKARDKLKGSKLENYMTLDQYKECERWAEKMARTFQRSSSQVEGRNGYLAFVHKANRGLQDQRLKILTVVHNYDIRGLDNKTPAERLFDKEFPDLFEFILENVTGFVEPRASRSRA